MVFVDEREKDTNDVGRDNNTSPKRQSFYLKQLWTKDSGVGGRFGLREFGMNWIYKLRELQPLGRVKLHPPKRIHRASDSH